MKKNIKGLFGLGLALAMAVTGATASFAGNQSLTFKGTIADSDVKMEVTLPTSTALTIKPFAASQIFTTDDLQLTAPDSVGVSISLAGYTATATSKTAADAITFKTSATTDYGTSVKKEAAIAIYISKDSDTGTDKDTENSCYKPAAFNAEKSIIEQVTKKADKDYDGKTVTTFQKATSTASVDLAKDGNATFAILGTMNPNANWEAGDAITVTPIFKFSPYLAADETTTA